MKRWPIRRLYSDAFLRSCRDKSLQKAARGDQQGREGFVLWTTWSREAERFAGVIRVQGNAISKPSYQECARIAIHRAYMLNGYHFLD